MVSRAPIWLFFWPVEESWRSKLSNDGWLAQATCSYRFFCRIIEHRIRLSYQFFKDTFAGKKVSREPQDCKQKFLNDNCHYSCEPLWNLINGIVLTQYNHTSHSAGGKLIYKGKSEWMLKITLLKIRVKLQNHGHIILHNRAPKNSEKNFTLASLFINIESRSLVIRCALQIKHGWMIKIIKYQK